MARQVRLLFMLASEAVAVSEHLASRTLTKNLPPSDKSASLLSHSER